MTKLAIGFIALFLGAVFVVALPRFFARAFDASSTNFFLRQYVQDVSGQGTSTTFGVRDAGGQSAFGISTSSGFRLESGPLYNLFKSVRPRYEQVHFHWRNDDGTETTATAAASEDVGLANLAKSTVKRLRLEISNEGGTLFGFAPQQFRIEYASQGGGCSSGTYTDVGAVGGDWDMEASQLTEAGDTTNIAVSTGGVTDENATFLNPNGGQRETTSQTGNLSVSSFNFVELEYAMQALAAATDGATYCFRLTNAGSATDFVYTRYATTTLASGNSAPTVSAVSLNNGNPITLTVNATTSVNITFTVTDTDGCADVFTNGNVTSTAFRSGAGSSCAPNNLSCYTVSTSTHNCSGGSSANATSTFQIYYFAQATDASSSFPSENWQAFVLARDAANATGSVTSAGVELNTLLGIDVTSTTIGYGTIGPGANTGPTNQTSSVKNAGNASTTLNLSGTALTLASNSIATSSQHYATSSFTFGGSEELLSGTPTIVSGFLLTSPTSTNAVSSLIFWGIEVPAGKATGTYSGTNTFTAVFSP